MAYNEVITLEKVTNSRLSTVNMDNLPFGRVFSDHMLVARCNDGQWEPAEIVPYGKLQFAPSMATLHYGQSIFEGMKAYRTPDGQPVLFRPDANFNRLNRSAQRMCMPEIPEELFMEGLRKLIQVDEGWIPPQEKGSLYIRPVYFASEEAIGVRPSENYTLVIFTGPVGKYYSEPVSLLASREFIRAATGGVGSAKTSGNYAASMYPDRLAKQQGYHNVLWLDARENRFIEECGTMNIFFVLEDTVVVPMLTGTILPGVTRNSCIRLLKDNGYKVEERLVSIFEIAEAYNEGRLREAFGSGTAATIAHIQRIGFNGKDMVLPPLEERKVGNWLLKTMTDIRNGVADDPYGWVVPV
jgi:branched-chain amino acid aminotransferase